jgi:oxygen-dependent protoporphyrinogen oxidase
VRVVVIGAGIGGLVAGLRLDQAGIDVTVLDAAQRPGGVIGTERSAGWLLERAAGSFLGDGGTGGVPGVGELCDELGVPTVGAAPSARKRWVYIDGKLQAVPSGPWSLLTSDLLTWRGKLELLREPLRPTRADSGDESVHAFATRRLGAEVARALVAPAVTGIYATPAHEVSLRAGFPRLAAMAEHGGLVRGALHAALGRRRARGTEPSRPRGLRAPEAGMGAVVAAVAARLGERLRLGVDVRHVRLLDSGAGVVIDTASGELRADACVLAVPARIGAAMIVGAPALADGLAQLRRHPAAVVHLGYGGPIPAADAGFGALIADGEAPRVLGILFESTLWPGRAPTGHTLLRLIYGGGRDPSAVELDDAALLAQAERDVATVLGVTALPVRRSVVRWRDGIGAMPVGHRARVDALMDAARARRLVLAGAGLLAVSVNDLCVDAARVVAQVQELA